MEFVNLFVYGSLKRGYPNHPILQSCVKEIKNATIKGTLYDIKLGFPAVQLKGNYTIKGELAIIPKEYLEYFDYFEGVPRLYQRQMVKVTTEDNKTTDAFVYTMRVLPLGSSIIGSGNW